MEITGVHERGCSAAIAARWAASALEAPLRVVAATARPAPGETGQEWLADGGRFEARFEARERRYREAKISLHAGVTVRSNLLYFNTYCVLIYLTEKPPG